MAHLRKLEQRGIPGRRSRCGSEKAHLVAWYCPPPWGQNGNIVTLYLPSQQPRGYWRKLVTYCDSWSTTCSPKPWTWLTPQKKLSIRHYLNLFHIQFSASLSDFPAHRLDTDDDSWQQEEITVLWQLEE